MYYDQSLLVIFLVTHQKSSEAPHTAALSSKSQCRDFWEHPHVTCRQGIPGEMHLTSHHPQNLRSPDKILEVPQPGVTALHTSERAATSDAHSPQAAYDTIVHIKWPENSHIFTLVLSATLRALTRGSQLEWACECFVPSEVCHQQLRVSD